MKDQILNEPAKYKENLGLHKKIVRQLQVEGLRNRVH